MKIAKKLIIALAVIILLVIVATFISIKYEEHRNKSDQALAVECKRDVNMEQYGIEEFYDRKYFLVESSPKSRSTEDYYNRAFQLKTDIDNLEISESGVFESVDAFDYWSDAYDTLRTNKYIHLFLTMKKPYYRAAQDELEIHQELIDEVVAGTHKWSESYVPTWSINRETLELTKWKTAGDLSKSVAYSCEKIDPLILHNRVKASEEKAKGGVKKI